MELRKRAELRSSKKYICYVQVNLCVRASTAVIGISRWGVVIYKVHLIYVEKLARSRCFIWGEDGIRKNLTRMVVMVFNGAVCMAVLVCFVIFELAMVAVRFKCIIIFGR